MVLRGLQTLLLMLPLLWSGAAAADGGDPYLLTRDSLVMQGYPDPRLTGAGWRYHPGDDPSWASPELDDSSWETANPWLSPGALPRSGWSGAGWFRLWIRIEPALRDKPLALTVMAYGSAEIYLDGKRIGGRGDLRAARAGDNPAIYAALVPPLTVTFHDERPHLLAVRFASTRVGALNRVSWRGGVLLSFTDPLKGGTFWRDLEQQAHRINFLFIGATLMLALLHLLLYLFYRDKRENLYYSLGVLSFCVLSGSTFWFWGAKDVDSLLVAITCFGAAIALGSIALTRFFYAVFMPVLPRQFWVILSVGLILALTSWAVPRWMIYLYAGLCLVELFRVMIVAMIRREDGAWIIGIGGMLWIIGASLQMLGDSGLLPPMPFAYLYGFWALLVSISVYLARATARDKSELSRQLVQIQALSEATLAQERRARQEELARKALEEANARKELLLKEAEKREKVLRELEVAHRQLRETQAHLVQSGTIAALGQLVAGVAHEVNSPLGAIRSTNDSLVRALRRLRTALDQESSADRDVALKAIGEASQIIASGSERVAEIVNRLRSFAHLDEAEFKLIDIREGIEDALVLLRHQLADGIQVTRNLDPVPRIACYPRQINQVLVNLLLNAKQAIQDRDTEEPGEIRVATTARNQHVSVIIRDTGVGIPKEDLGKIFDPGFTTRGVRVGTGLGLAICHRIVTEHKGQIEVDSTVGQGTTVTVTLPTTLTPPAG